jgi:inner membrane protein
VYRTGHLGVSLFVFAPIGFALLRLGEPTLAVAAGAAMLWLTMLPDVDIRLPGVSHRGPTHTLAFAALVGLGFAGVGLFVSDSAGLPPRVDLVAFGFFVGALTVVAHLLADWLTPAGIAPFWPLSARRYSLGVARASNPLANYLLFALGVFAVSGAALLAVRM